jgi:putative ABC transport system permease protein
MIKMTSNQSEKILPFKIITNMSDYVKLYTILALVLVIGFIILARFTSRIKMDQAIKLGED